MPTWSITRCHNSEEHSTDIVGMFCMLRKKGFEHNSVRISEELSIFLNTSINSSGALNMESLY